MQQRRRMLVESLDRRIVEPQSLGHAVDEIRIEHRPPELRAECARQLAAPGAELATHGHEPAFGKLHTHSGALSGNLAALPRRDNYAPAVIVYVTTRVPSAMTPASGVASNRYVSVRPGALTWLMDVTRST